MKKVPNFWKVEPIHFNLDTDRDNVLDYKDCRPFNPKKQHVTGNMKRRIRELDINVCDNYEGFIYHILSNEAKKYAPISREHLLAVFNKYPGILSKIEKLDKKKPITLIHTKVKLEPYDSIGYSEKSDNEPYNKIVTTSQLPKMVEELINEYEEEIQRRIRIDTTANTLYHELRHIEQKQYYLFDKIDKKTTPYKERIKEIDARVGAEEEISKYYRRSKTPMNDLVNFTFKRNKNRKR